MKKITITFVLYLLLLMPVWSAPKIIRESSGLRLVACRRLTLFSSISGPRLVFQRLITAYVMNIGDRPITVPTVAYPDSAHAWFGSTEDNVEIVSYDFYFQKDDDGRKIVESPLKFQPVTLVPGEMTELSFQWEVHDSPPLKSSEDEAKWRGKLSEEMKNDAEISDYVSLHIPKEIADRYGWWSGELLVPAADKGVGPNQPPLRMPVSGTPAARAPVAPPAGIAGR